MFVIEKSHWCVQKKKKDWQLLRSEKCEAVM